MNGHDDPELTPAQYYRRQPSPTQEKPDIDTLTLPLHTLNKGEIESGVEEWLNNALEVHNHDDLYVYLKQAELAVSSAVEKLQSSAFNAISARFGGAMSGEILGHEVTLSFPSKKIYPAKIEQLEAQQKLELKAAKAQAEAEGLVKKEEGVGRITEKLRAK